MLMDLPHCHKCSAALARRLHVGEGGFDRDGEKVLKAKWMPFGVYEADLHLAGRFQSCSGLRQALAKSHRIYYRL